MADLFITPEGDLQVVYTEEVDLLEIGHALGEVETCRASHVEPTEGNEWTADLTPVGGPFLGPYRLRSEALQAEQDWLAAHLAGGG